ncbi:MAG: hypothetical protein ACT6QX_20560, partial [Sphingopyxis sp.]|uniref:hypothetical protein n=1 Tax=Sphingopyxis sp. TaxID=1908224 RepID=UPI004037BBF9
WARPHDSATERAFCREYLDRVPDMRADGFGNRMLEIGDRPRTLWSCHVDTVAAVGGHQAVGVDEHGIAHLCDGKAGMSLGADDGAGLWIMLGMIAAWMLEQCGVSYDDFQMALWAEEMDVDQGYRPLMST